jgi:hypothetical protein
MRLGDVRLRHGRSVFSEKKRDTSITLPDGTVGKPLILLGKWDWESARAMSDQGVFVTVSPFDSDDMSVAPERAFMDVEYADLGGFVEKRERSGPRLLRVRLDLSDMSYGKARDAYSWYRSEFPDDMLIVGPIMSPGERIVEPGDFFAMEEFGGYDSEPSFIDYVERMTGIGLEFGPDDLRGRVASLGCRTPGDVVKCLALGATLVSLSSEYYDVELIERGIDMAMSSAEATSISELRGLVMTDQT